MTCENRTRREARAVLIKEFDVVQVRSRPATTSLQIAFHRIFKPVVTCLARFLQIFQAAVKGVDSGECPNRWILVGEDRTAIPHIIPSFSNPPPVCPTGTFSTAENFCEMCPDMTASDKGSTSIAACVPFLSLILVGKDASLTYQARTEPRLGGIGNAQPNAVDIYGLSLKNASYIKVRGYAVQPDSLVNVYDPAQGYQADRCNAFGLNCFNQTDFRYRLSQAAGSLISPNQVRTPLPITAKDIPILVRLLRPACNGSCCNPALNPQSISPQPSDLICKHCMFQTRRRDYPAPSTHNCNPPKPQTPNPHPLPVAVNPLNPKTAPSTRHCQPPKP